MSTLTILHLTDLHRGAGKYARWIYPNVEQILLEDLKRTHDRTGPWDLVCFTGDLVQSGGGQDGTEFDQLDDTLGRLWAEFKSLGSDPQLLSVPGNHDLVRPDGRRAAVKLLRGWWKDEDVQESFWEEAKSEYRAVVTEALAPYLEWEEKHPFRSLSVKRGLLPGDFSLSYEKNGWKVGIVGLNSTFLQLGRGQYEGKLALSPAQLTTLQGDHYPDWFKEHHFSLLLTHHPPEWLASEAHHEYTAHIAPPGRFLAHLCGHLHTAWSEEASVGGAKRPHLIRGASLFGLEYFGQVKKKRRRDHGYGVLRFDLDPEEATWRRWPRRAIKKQGGYWKLERNLQAEDHLEDDGGTPAAQVEIGANAPKLSPRSSAFKATRRAREEVDLGEVDKLERAFEETMGTARLVTTRIWQRLKPHVIFDGQEVELTVVARGDTTVRGIYAVQSSQKVPFVPYEIVADDASPAVHYLEDLDFDVRPVGRTRKEDEVFYLQTDNFPRRKRVVLFFHPQIDARKRKIEVSYHWPGLFAKLMQEGADDLAFEWHRPVRRGEIRIRFSAKLGEINCKLVSGLRKGVKLSRYRDKDDYLVWRCRCRDAPAGDYLLALSRAS